MLCAAIAAAGHATRFVLVSPAFGCEVNIIVASLVGSLIIGLLAVLLSGRVKSPAEGCIFPALLPMFPGVYAYRTFGGAAMCVLGQSRDTFAGYFYEFAYNGLMALCILVAMAVGAVLPIFLFEKISFQATRQHKLL